MAHAQVCVTGISTWEIKTVSNATTPVSMDAVMVTHVQTMPATQTVPHVAAQEPINVLHATATPLWMMVAAHVMQVTDTSEVPTTVNSPLVKIKDVISVSLTTTNTHVSCAKTTSNTSKATTKDSDTVSTAMMTISIHIQLVEDVNATKS